MRDENGIKCPTRGMKPFRYLSFYLVGRELEVNGVRSRGYDWPTQPSQNKKKQTDRKQLTKKNCKIKEDIENFFYGRKREADRRDMRQLMDERESQTTDAGERVRTVESSLSFADY